VIEIMPSGDEFVLVVNGNELPMRFRTKKSADLGAKIPTRVLAEKWAEAQAGDGVLDLEDLDVGGLN